LTRVSLTRVHLIHHPKKSAKRIRNRTNAKKGKAEIREIRSIRGRKKEVDIREIRGTRVDKAVSVRTLHMPINH